MGAVIWFLAALVVLWFALLHVLPLDEPLIFLSPYSWPVYAPLRRS